MSCPSASFAFLLSVCAAEFIKHSSSKQLALSQTIGFWRCMVRRPASWLKCANLPDQPTVQGGGAWAQWLPGRGGAGGAPGAGRAPWVTQWVGGASGCCLVISRAGCADWPSEGDEWWDDFHLLWFAGIKKCPLLSGMVRMWGCCPSPHGL
jgi:hypothetical protein